VEDGALIEEIEVLKDKFCARLSAPGYLDCTDWHGPYDTAEDALQDVKDAYGFDEDEEED